MFDAFSEQEESSNTDEVSLQEVDISDGVNNAISDKIIYPCVIIEDIKTKEEVNFFLKRKCNPQKALPFYLLFDGYVKQLGMFELSLENLLAVRCVSNYKIRVCKSAVEQRLINVNNPDQLLKFITF